MTNTQKFQSRRRNGMMTSIASAVSLLISLSPCAAQDCASLETERGQILKDVGTLFFDYPISNVGIAHCVLGAWQHKDDAAKPDIFWCATAVCVVVRGENCTAAIRRWGDLTEKLSVNQQLSQQAKCEKK